jgi:hypothetical protein
VGLVLGCDEGVGRLLNAIMREAVLHVHSIVPVRRAPWVGAPMKG